LRWRRGGYLATVVAWGAGRQAPGRPHAGWNGPPPPPRGSCRSVQPRRSSAPPAQGLCCAPPPGPPPPRWCAASRSPGPGSPVVGSGELALAVPIAASRIGAARRPTPELVAKRPTRSSEGATRSARCAQPRQQPAPLPPPGSWPAACPGRGARRAAAVAPTTLRSSRASLLVPKLRCSWGTVPAGVLRSQAWTWRVCPARPPQHS
jgi:hypothetical protein